MPTAYDTLMVIIIIFGEVEIRHTWRYQWFLKNDSVLAMFHQFVRMAKATKWLQAILDYMKKVKLITSTVFGQFS